jgi:hypothetical protein
MRMPLSIRRGADLLVTALPSLLVHVGVWSGYVEAILQLLVSTPREGYLWRRLLLLVRAVASYGPLLLQIRRPLGLGGGILALGVIYLVALLLLPLSFSFVVLI